MLSLSIDSRPFPLSYMDARDRLLVEVVSKVVCVSSSLSMKVSAVSSNVGLNVELLLAVLLSKGSSRSLTGSSVSAAFPFSLMCAPSFGVV